jgi:hypothetical protein
MGPIDCPETSVTNYHPTKGNISEERRPQLHRGGSLKSRMRSGFGGETWKEGHFEKLLWDEGMMLKWILKK